MPSAVQWLCTAAAAAVCISHDTSWSDNCRHDEAQAFVFLLLRLTRHAVLTDVDVVMSSAEGRLAEV